MGGGGGRVIGKLDERGAETATLEEARRSVRGAFFLRNY